MSDYLVDWTAEQRATLENGILLAKHRLHELDLFSDENIIRLIDAHPARDLGINTMSDSFDDWWWREGERNGLAAEQVFELVQKGRLWLNFRKVLQHHAGLRRIVDGVYDELEEEIPGFIATNRSGNLLVSSPSTKVNYHLDVPVNMLWHLRGHKRVYVYPPHDERFAPREIVEDICACQHTEALPFDWSFDKAAQVFDVEPGQILTWPQMTPHKVENQGDLNVSLSTEHRNPRATRRINVLLANRLLRRQLGLPAYDTQPSGLSAHAKETLIRGVRLARRWVGHPDPPGKSYPITFKLDPRAPEGFVLLESAAEADESLALAM